MDTNAVLGRAYQPRVLDAALAQALAAGGAVVIEGARASGKTMTALNAAASYTFLDDPDVQQLMAIAPRSVLEGAAPRLLDEWQLAPELWNLVRRAVDASVDPGRFILTGSSVPSDDITRHTGAGRFIRLRQRTMSWWEKLPPVASQVSLAGLFDGSTPGTNLDLSPSLTDVISGLLTAGFPSMTSLTPEQSALRLRGYVEDVARTDVHRIATVRHGADVLTHLIRSLARSVASVVSFKTLTTDVRAHAPAITEETVSNYVGLLERLFIVEAQAPWTPTLRSRARVRTSPKLHLVDPALAAASLGAGPTHLERDLSTLGVLFESAVVHDLAVLVSSLSGEVRHYRDSSGREIDAVITLPDGRWGAVEIKLGGGQIAAAVTSLNNAINQIDIEALGEPSFRLVVTGTGPIVVTDDGTISAPLRALAP